MKLILFKNLICLFFIFNTVALHSITEEEVETLLNQTSHEFLDKMLTQQKKMLAQKKVKQSTKLLEMSELTARNQHKMTKDLNIRKGTVEEIAHQWGVNPASFKQYLQCIYEKR